MNKKGKINFKTYKDLEENKDTQEGYNYLEQLSISILQTLCEMYKMNDAYSEYKLLFLNSIENDLNIFFNQIKDLIWMKFCNVMRDYSNVIFEIMKCDEEIKKYLEVKNYIEETNFLSNFVLDTNEYIALSLTLHNFNKHSFGIEKWEKAFDIYNRFNYSIINNDIEEIKKEFENVIRLFRKCENYDIHSVLFCFENNSLIFGTLTSLMDHLIKTNHPNCITHKKEMN